MLVSVVQQSESAIIHVYPLFWISIPSTSPQSIEESSLSYTVILIIYYMSVLYIVSMVYVRHSQSPNSSNPPSFSPWVSIHLFSMSVSLFQSMSFKPKCPDCWKNDGNISHGHNMSGITTQFLSSSVPIVSSKDCASVPIRQIPSGVLANICKCLFLPLPRKPFVASADSHSINSLTMAKFKILL